MRIPTWFLLGWVVMLIMLAIGSSAFAYSFVRDRAAELDSVLELPDPPQLNRPAEQAPTQTLPPTMIPTPTTIPTTGPADQSSETPADAAQPASTAVAAVPDADAASAQYVWDDPRRVSVLLLGIDQREGEEGTFPTDTIILLSLDPVGGTGAILSIPRDLWVEYPGLQQQGRINSASIVGDTINYPGGGGPMFAVKVVEKELGIRIPYYMLINFDVFYTVIDALGPIEVCPSEVIHDDLYPDGSYGYMTVHFDPGCQELDSEHLLQYARVRHNDSDIGRSARQQEVILAVRKKILSTGGIAALIPQAVPLWESMEDNIKTNLTFDDVMSLAFTAENVPSENIRQDQIGFEDVTMGTAETGEAVLIPISSDIRAKVAELFRPPD